jgi:hypothetical protein
MSVITCIVWSLIVQPSFPFNLLPPLNTTIFQIFKIHFKFQSLQYSAACSITFYKPTVKKKNEMSPSSANSNAGTVLFPINRAYKLFLTAHSIMSAMHILNKYLLSYIPE